MQQQLSRALRIGHHVGRSACQWGNVGADEPGFAVAQQNVAVDQLGLARANALDLPTLQGESGLESLLEVVVMLSALVEGDGAR